jgi:hypothetical protein
VKFVIADQQAVEIKGRTCLHLTEDEVVVWRGEEKWRGREALRDLELYILINLFSVSTYITVLL